MAPAVTALAARLRRAAAAAIALAALLALGASAATMPPVRMTFADATTGAPIPGVVAAFYGTARQGTFTGHGGRTATLFLTEAVSDAQGEVRFPAQEFDPRPFFMNTNYENPGMIVLAPGYRLEILHNQRSIVPRSVQEISHWEYDGQTRKLQPWRGEAEAPQILSLVDIHLKMLLAAPCDWQKVPRLLVMTERIALGPAGSDTAGRRRGPVVTPLSNILRNDAAYRQHGCPSPQEFFAPYLR